MRVIPREPRVARLLLERCLDKMQSRYPGAAKRVLLIGVGLWYNPHTYCVDGAPHPRRDCHNQTAGEACFVKDAKHRCSDEDYAVARKVSGTVYLHDYEQDLRRLAQVLVELRKRVDALLWFEVPAEHFSPSGSWDPAEESRYATTACMQEAPRESNERNPIAVSMMRQAGPADLAVIPLFQALRTSGNLHRGRGDCGHWQDPSDATTHMASAALSVLSTVL